VLGQDGQAARLVAGQGAEFDVLADGGPPGQVAADQGVSAQVGTASLVQPAEPGQRQQGAGQYLAWFVRAPLGRR
jgi:hypothetical protein